MYIFYIIGLYLIPKETYHNIKTTNKLQDAIILSLGATTLTLATELAIQSNILEKPILLLGILLFLFIKNTFFIRYVLEKIESSEGLKHFLNIKRFHKLNKKN